MKNTIAFIIMVMVLFTFSLSACDGRPENGLPDAGTDNGESYVPEETADGDDYISTLPANNYKGKEFRLIIEDAPRHPNVAEEMIGEAVNDALYERDNRISDMFDIKFKYIKHGWLSETLKSAVQKSVNAGLDEYDLILAPLANGINVFAPAGQLVNLKDVPHIDLHSPWWSQSMYYNTQINNNLYATSGPMALSYYYAPVSLSVNLRIAAEYDLGNIYKYVLDGTWTLDKFTELLKGVSRDMNGDGIMTVYDDLFALSLDDLAGQAFFIGAGGTQMEYDGDGIPQFSVASEKNLNIIAKLADIIADKENVFATEILGVADKTKPFVVGTSLFMGIGISGVIQDCRAMEDDYGILPFPKWNEKQEKYITYGSPWGPCGIAVPKTNTDLDMTGLLMEAMAYMSYTNVGPKMSSVTLNAKIARDEDSVKMLEIIYEDVLFDLIGIYNFGNMGIMLRDQIIHNKGDGFISKYERNIGAAQKALDTFIESFE